ncbi:metastasis associated 1 [Rhinolophus ferrumequinum]|uniref:Metastasis associated 1 n=1 Tax=Rhinolophus ferrumequinum TaxID=59479 RepID=A0A7J7QYE2_RHIFE|nr:metastasis associated 1 [Rhinolophus ferrumequinum]
MARGRQARALGPAGPVRAVTCRLCASCWTYWKKYGGLKMPTRLDGERPGPNRSNMSPHGIPARSSGSPKFAMKTRQAFYLHTTKLTRLARRLCREILRPRHAARHPYVPINSAAHPHLPRNCSWGVGEISAA